MLKNSLFPLPRLSAGLLCLASLGFVALSGCAELDRNINAVNKVVGLPPMPAPAGAARAARMSAPQEAALGEQLNANLNNAQLIRARAEASPVIGKVVRLAACYPAPNFEFGADKGFIRTLSREVSPDLTVAHWAMGSTSYHPRDQCMSIRMIDEWSMPALNAIQFRVVYLSEVSGESRNISYLVVKHSNGEWLFREI